MRSAPALVVLLAAASLTFACGTSDEGGPDTGFISLPDASTNMPHADAGVMHSAVILIDEVFDGDTVRVRPLLGGLDAWLAAGHPTEHGIPARFVTRPSAKAGTPA